MSHFKLNRPKSNFNHMYGKAANQADTYLDIRITKTPFDGLFTCVNTKYLAIITEAGGGAAFMILPLEQTGRVKADQPMVGGHTGRVLDIKWNPFDDSLIASCSEDTTAKVWQVIEKKDGVYGELKVDLRHHQKKVTHIEWHPTSRNVLLTAGMDKMIYIWDLMKPEIMYQFEFDCDSFLSFNFNYNGSQLALSTKEAPGKDGLIYVLDVRSEETLAVWSAHPKNAQAVFTKDGRVFTTGSSKMSDRKCSLWDISKPDKPKHLQSVDIDNCNRVLFPFYDCDINVIYLWGKGESAVKFYEIFDKAPYIYYLNTITSANSGKGLNFMPKLGMDVTQNEMARIYKLVERSSGSGMVEVVSCLVSRIDKTFQDDLYPDTIAPIAPQTADDWKNGGNAEPELMSLRPRFDELSTNDTTTEGTSSLGSSALGSSSLGSSSLGGSSLSNKPTGGVKKPEPRKFSAPVSSGTTVATENTTPPPEPARATPPLQPARETPSPRSTNYSPAPASTGSPAPDSAEVLDLKEELAQTKQELKDTKESLSTLEKKFRKMDTRMRMMENSVSILQEHLNEEHEAKVIVSDPDTE